MMEKITNETVLEFANKYDLFNDDRAIKIDHDNNGFYITKDNEMIQLGEGYEGLKGTEEKLLRFGEVGDPESWESYKAVNETLNAVIQYCLDHGLKATD